MGRWLFVGAVDLLGRSRIQGVVHQRGFARAGHAGDTGEQAHREFSRDVLQVVAASAHHSQRLLGSAVHHGGGETAKHIGRRCSSSHAATVLNFPRAALGGHRDVQSARHIAASQRRGVGFNFCRRALRHHPPSMHSRAWPHVDAMVSSADHVLVVFHHQHAVTDVAQVFQGVDEAVVVALVQANAGFVQHIHHACQARANLRGQADSLRLTARQRVGAARETQVGETHII